MEKLENIPRPTLNRIPGELLKTSNEKHIKDLSKLNKIQLIEIKEREEHLLSKKSQLQKLPDKGKRIIEFHEKILKEIEHRNEIEMAAKLFSNLNITATGEAKLNELEWTGKMSDNDINDFNLNPNSITNDIDELDPLKIIAQSRNLLTIKKEKVPEVESLITTKDLLEIESFNKKTGAKKKIKNTDETIQTDNNNSSINVENSIIEPCALYLYDKEIVTSPLKEKFMPYKTTTNNSHDIEKEKLRKIGGAHWEITAATPKPLRNSSAQLLSLKDSVEIQINYLEKYKKLQELRTTERLIEKYGKNGIQHKINLPKAEIITGNKLFQSYRKNESDSDLSDQENIEVHDDDDDDRKGSVNFTVLE